MQFTFQLLTRSGRITYDDLRLRDSRFGDAVDRWCAQKASGLHTIVAPPPMFTPLTLRSLTLSNRVVLSPELTTAQASSTQKGQACNPEQDGSSTIGYTGHSSNN